MTQIISNTLQEIELSQINSLALSQLFVKYGSDFLSTDKLEVIVNQDSTGNITNSREIKDVADLKRNMSKLCYKDSSGFYVQTFDKPDLYFKGFSVPSTHESISIDKDGATDSEKVPYGLKRTLETQQQTPSYDDNAYLYIQVGNEWGFVKQNSVFYFEGTEKKSYLDAIRERKDITKIQFFNADNEEIQSIYTEYEYRFGRIIKKEVIDASKGKKSVVSIDDAGNETVESSGVISKAYSSQSFETVEVADDKKPGKTKKVGQVKSVNYSNVLVDPALQNDKNLYIAISVKDSLNTHVMMVKLEDVVDEHNNSIADLSSMVGKRVKIKNGDVVVATSEPLTYEQANLRYRTIKSYQEIDSLPNEDTCLRLKDGNYVKELDAVQPFSYKIAPNSATSFDKYLVKLNSADGTNSFVVVDAKYFEKNGRNKNFDLSVEPIKLLACDYNDANCCVLQTTSKNNSVEQCKITRDIAGLDCTIDNKKAVYDEFKTSYSEGNYSINSVYVNGEREELQNSLRYKYADESYTADYADDLLQYRAMKTENISIQDGEIKGGAKYNYSKGLSAAYGKWAQALLAGVSIVPAAGLFIPALAPLVAIYSVGVLAAAPIIPIANLGIGLVKNRTIAKSVRNLTNYKDKTEHNRTQQIKDINAEIKHLFEIQGELDKSQFDDAYAKLLNKIVMLSTTTSNKTLTIVDGKADVNPNNANLANEYVRKYKSVKKDYDACKKKVEKLTAKGKTVPDKLQARFNQLEAEMQMMRNTVMGTSYETHAKFEALKTTAASMKLYHSLSTLDGDELKDFLSEVGLDNTFDVSRIGFDLKHGLTIDGISINTTDKKLNKLFKNREADLTAWLELKDKIALAVEGVAMSSVKPPIEVGVESLSIALASLEELYKECESKLNFSLSMSDDFKIKQEIENEVLTLRAEVNSIYNSAIVLTDVREVEEKIEELTIKRDEIITVQNSANKANSLTEKIETLNERFNELVGDIEKELEIFIDIEDVATVNGKYLQQKQTYINSCKKAKNTKTLEELETNVNDMSNSVLALSGVLEDMIATKEDLDKSYITLSISHYKDSVSNKIADLKTKPIVKFNEYIINLENDKNEIGKLIEQVNLPNTTVAESKDLNVKAYLISQIIAVGVNSLLVMNELIEANSAVSLQISLGALLTEMANIIKVNGNMSVEELKLSLAKAQMKYENEIALYKPMKKGKKVTDKNAKDIGSEKSKERNLEDILFDTKINSEDRLVVLLKAKPESKDRIKLLEYIKEKSKVNINERDILDTIDRINEKHKKGKNATSNVKRLKNKNIEVILKYGQQYLTIYAEEIKERTSPKTV